MDQALGQERPSLYHRRPALPPLPGLSRSSPGFRAAARPGARAGAAVAVEIAPVEKGVSATSAPSRGRSSPSPTSPSSRRSPAGSRSSCVDIGDRLTQRPARWPLLEDEEYQQQVLQAEADLRRRPGQPGGGHSPPRSMAQKEHRAGQDPPPERHPVGRPARGRPVGLRQPQDARLKVTEAQVANQQAALETARVRLSYTRIRAAWETGRRRPLRRASASSTQGPCSRPTRPSCRSSSSSPSRPSSTSRRRITSASGPSQAVILTSGAFPGEEFQGRIVASIAPLLQGDLARGPGRDRGRQRRRSPQARHVRQRPDRVRQPRRTRPSSPTAPSSTRGAAPGDVPGRPRRPRRPVFQPVHVGIVEGDRAEILEPADARRARRHPRPPPARERDRHHPARRAPPAAAAPPAEAGAGDKR
ncbi:MAG: hypothetical protein M0C28_47580 [Candidatus Moduliflexus flocculans]|nr:hypothetical protein [Candidatus Moduliflexus flocculans]